MIRLVLSEFLYSFYSLWLDFWWWVVSISILFPLSEITNLSVRKCNGHTNDTCAKRLHTYTKILKVGEQHLQHSMQLHIHHSLVVKAISQQQSCSIEDKHFQVIAILSHCNILIPIYKTEKSKPCLTSMIDWKVSFNQWFIWSTLTFFVCHRYASKVSL